MNSIEFVIDNKNLYLEKTLVDIGCPLFFVCKDDRKEKYVVLCTNTEALTYIVQQTTRELLLDVLQSRITLKDFFKRGKKTWRVESGTDYTKDKVSPIKHISPADMPEDSMFDYSNKYIKSYIEILKNELLFEK